MIFGYCLLHIRTNGASKSELVFVFIIQSVFEISTKHHFEIQVILKQSKHIQKMLKHIFSFIRELLFRIIIA